MIPIVQDIWNWITEFVETNHEFYNYKFPPCPYARSARLAGTVDVQAWPRGSINQFIQQQARDLVADPKLQIRVLVFPAWVRWHWLLHRWIERYNQQLIPQDYYAQYGLANGTESQYPGWFQGRPYFIVIINQLSDVLSAHSALVNTDYYSSWTAAHYHSVVERRQQAHDKHKGS